MPNATSPKSNSEATEGKPTVLPDADETPQLWNLMFVISFVLAVVLDPLFLYIPILKDNMKCIGLDSNMKIAALVLRSLTDIVYVLKIISQICDLLKQNQDAKTESGILDSEKRKKSWILFRLIVDILAVLPIPQVVLIVFFTKTGGSGWKAAIMNSLILVQYVPRVFCIYLACKEYKLPISLENWEPWVKGGLSFFMYILGSNVFGGLWYFFSIQRLIHCWQSACQLLNDHDECNSEAFQCHNQSTTIRNLTLAYDSCPINPPNPTLFDFGIFLNVLQPKIAGTTNYLRKLTICLLWALRNLSSFGSNLQPSIDIWENVFATSVSIIGLLLFLYLIGKLQIYMGSETSMREEDRWTREVQKKLKIELTVRLEPKIGSWLDKNKLDRHCFKSKVEEEVVALALKTNKNDIDENQILANLSPGLQQEIKNEKDTKQIIDPWLAKNNLDHQDFKSKIVEAVEQKRRENPKFELDPDNILQIVPLTVRNEIMESKYLLLDRLKKVPLLQNVNEKDLKIISEKLKIQKHTKSASIIKEKESLKMIFIVDGVARIEKQYWLTSFNLKAGESYGEEILLRPTDKATESVKAATDVVALILEAGDLQSVVDEYKLHISQESIASSKLPSKFEDRFSMLKKVPKLKKMEAKVLKNISVVLKGKSYSKGEQIFQEGQELDKMILVTHGTVAVKRSDKKRRELYKVGTLYGEELLHWVLDTRTTTGHPVSVGIATADSQVDALLLHFSDLEKSVLPALESPPSSDIEMDH